MNIINNEILLENIKFISDIKANEKIDVTRRLKYKNNILTSVKRYISNESRYNTYDFLKFNIKNYIKFLEIKKITNDDIRTLYNLIIALNNIIQTYQYDNIFICKILALCNIVDAYLLLKSNNNIEEFI